MTPRSLWLALWALPLIAAAEPPAAPITPGADTRAWLDLQASGSAAEGEARPLPGDVADAIYQRWLQSFSHPIPETLGSDEGSGAASNGNNGR